MGVVHTVEPLLPRMIGARPRPDRADELARSFVGPPGTAAYCASKAAVRIWGEGLRDRLAPQGVAVSVICPGFVDTPLTRRNPFPMPMLMSAERGGRADQGAVSPASHARIAFPGQLVSGAARLRRLASRLTACGQRASPQPAAGRARSRRLSSPLLQLAPARDVAVVLGQRAGEGVAAGAVGDEIEIVDRRRVAAPPRSSARPGLAIGPGGRPAMR